MRILHLSDTHGLHGQLCDMPDADVLVHSGDFTLGGTEKEVTDFLEWFLDLPYRHKIFIAGNHDDCLYQAEIEGLDSNCHYLLNSSVVIEGVRFHGVPLFMGDCISGLYETAIARIPADTQVLVTHQPPFGILDSAGGVSYGSPELLVKVSKIVPCLHLFGHVHGACGILDDGHTVFVNSALASGNYTALSSPRVINI